MVGELILLRGLKSVGANATTWGIVALFCANILHCSDDDNTSETNGCPDEQPTLQTPCTGTSMCTYIDPLLGCRNLGCENGVWVEFFNITSSCHPTDMCPTQMPAEDDNCSASAETSCTYNVEPMGCRSFICQDQSWTVVSDLPADCGANDN